MNEKRMNGDYEIINSMIVGKEEKTEIVLGYNEGALSPYVTWVCNPDIKDSYSWGHYFGSLDNANIDFFERGLSYARVDLEGVYESRKEKEEIIEATKYSMFDENAIKFITNNDIYKKIKEKKEVLEVEKFSELEAAIEELYEELVKENKIFSWEDISNLEFKEVKVTDVFGNEWNGEIFIRDDEGILSEFELEVFLENDKKDYITFKIEEIKSIEKDGEILYSPDMHKNEMELALEAEIEDKIDDFESEALIDDLSSHLKDVKARNCNEGHTINIPPTIRRIEVEDYEK